MTVLAASLVTTPRERSQWLWWVAQAAPPMTSANGPPYLIVIGTADPDFPDPAAEGQAIVAALSPGVGALRILEGAGHYIHAERPNELAALITNFLTEHHDA